MNEAQRQQALLMALTRADAGTVSFALRESGERVERGLEAYRANAEASADRALASAFPTLQAMLGVDDFPHLAREFWHAHPPMRGDLGEWGGELPGWLATHAAMSEWPWLADCARLDLALQRSERAADASLDAASLSLLESADPELLRLQLMPGVAVLSSAWPIASIHLAHQLVGDEADCAFAAVRSAIDAGRAEHVLVARKGWRALVHRLEPMDATWSQSLIDGVSLAQALVRVGEAFDFAAWLATALRESWLKGVVVSND